MSKDKVSIEEAIDRAGFGLYSYMMTGLAGLSIIAFACIGYGNSILIPASACELGTTPAQQGVLAAGPVIGSILGATVWGYLTDRRGRRSMMLASILGGTLINLVASISVNWVMLLALQFCASLFVAGVYSTSMSLLSESVPQARRNFVVLLVTSIFLLSQGFKAVFAIPIIPLSFSIYIPALGIYWNSWRTLVLVYSLPGFLTALVTYLLQESPKFLYSQGRDQEALDVLKAIHRLNNLRSLKEFDVVSISGKEEHMSAADKEASLRSPIRQLFSPPHRKHLIIMTLLLACQQLGAFQVWLPTIANQFMNILETGEGSELALCSVIRLSLDAAPDPDAVPCALNITAMLIVLAVAGLQSVNNLLLSLVVSRTGRRNLVFVVTAVCGLAGLLVNTVPSAAGSAALFALMLQGFIVMGLYTAIVVALFPTHLRALAIAIPVMGGRIMTFLNIQLLNIMLINNCEAGFYLFASIYAASGLVASFLPDDRRLAAPSTPTPAPPADAGARAAPEDTSKRPEILSTERL